MADDQSSIPSVVDGLIPVQRHIILYAFKNPNFQEVKEFIDYMFEHSAYFHGRRNLATTMTGLAQNYVGSNNINLLSPHGAPENYYFYTELSSITPHLFHESDEPLLTYLYGDQKSSKPSWFMPIIPMVLVNGIAGGIGTNYKPHDIIANLRRLLNHENPVPMDPWFQWFKGKIERRTATSYTTSGVVEERKDAPNKLFITELPIGKLAEDYEEFLEAAAQDNEPFIKEYIAHDHDNGTVTFEVVMSPDQMNKAREEGFENKFDLTTNLDTSNMCLLDADGAKKNMIPLKKSWRTSVAFVSIIIRKDCQLCLMWL